MPLAFLAHLGTLLTHVQPAVNQHARQLLYHQAAFQTRFPKPVAKAVFSSSRNLNEMQAFRGALNFSSHHFEGESLQMLEMLSNRLL